VSFDFPRWWEDGLIWAMFGGVLFFRSLRFFLLRNALSYMLDSHDYVSFVMGGVSSSILASLQDHDYVQAPRIICYRTISLNLCKYYLSKMDQFQFYMCWAMLEVMNFFYRFAVEWYTCCLILFFRGRFNSTEVICHWRIWYMLHSCISRVHLAISNFL
jgi:hypothetical protein